MHRARSPVLVTALAAPFYGAAFPLFSTVQSRASDVEHVAFIGKRRKVRVTTPPSLRIRQGVSLLMRNWPLLSSRLWAVAAR